CVTSEHRADDFAADIGLASVVIGHHALGRRQNRDPKAVIDARQVAHREIDATPRLGNPFDFPDYRLSVKIFELNFEFRPAAGMRHAGIAPDETFGLEHLEHTLALL